jgi:AraC-like DNA-binding protein
MMTTDFGCNNHSTLPFGWIGGTALAASVRGVPIDDMMLSAGVGGKTAILNPDTPINPAEFHLICNLLIKTVDDELHGAGKARMMRGTGTLGLQVMAAAPTLRAGLQSLIKLYGVAGNFCALELHEREDAELLIRSNLARNPMAFVVEEVLANWIYVQICYLLQSPMKLYSYSSSALHPKVGQLHPYFGCPVIASSVTAFRFPKYYLDMVPIVKLGEAPLLDSVMYWLEQSAKKNSYCGSLYDGKPVSLITLGILAESDMSFAACCDAVRSSERDLRYALSSEGSSFRELRRVALVNRMRSQLNDKASLDDVAADHGYSDARSLRRGLRAATGLSITSLRKLGSPAGMMGSPKVLEKLRDCLVPA